MFNAIDLKKILRLIGKYLTNRGNRITSHLVHVLRDLFVLIVGLVISLGINDKIDRNRQERVQKEQDIIELYSKLDAIKATIESFERLKIRLGEVGMYMNNQGGNVSVEEFFVTTERRYEIIKDSDTNRWIEELQMTCRLIRMGIEHVVADPSVMGRPYGLYQSYDKYIKLLCRRGNIAIDRVIPLLLEIEGGLTQELSLIE